MVFTAVTYNSFAIQRSHSKNKLTAFTVVENQVWDGAETACAFPGSAANVARLMGELDGRTIRIKSATITTGSAWATAVKIQPSLYEQGAMRFGGVTIIASPNETNDLGFSDCLWSVDAKSAVTSGHWIYIPTYPASAPTATNTSTVWVELEVVE